MIFDPVKFIALSDYKKENGEYDWEAYRKAQVENGDLCHECGGTARILGGPGHPVLCSPCERMRGQPASEIDHAKRIRCPKCGNIEEVDFEMNIWEAGEHDVHCSACDHKYVIETEVSYSFVSPPRLDDED